ncbi:unnamed protein product, partial [Rotaria sordida]
MKGIPAIPSNTRWARDGTTVAGGRGLGIELHNLFLPTSLIVDNDGTMYIADSQNNRIMAWKQ